MHNYQRIGCSPVAELLQKLVEDIVVAPHDRVRFGGEQVLDQPRPLQETLNSSTASWSSQLTELLVPAIRLNEIRALHCLTSDALNDDLHGPDIVHVRNCEDHVDVIHLLKECVNGIVTICLVNNYLQIVD